MSKITRPVILNETGIRIAEALEGMMAVKSAQRVVSLDTTRLAGEIVEVVGVPVYVGADDLATYAAYGLTEIGWYVFARIYAPVGVTVTANTEVTGAHAIIFAGTASVDVAVRFEVAAVAQTVEVNWGDVAETFVFRAADLAVRNLDYRTTFYVYDLAPFVTWEFALTADAAFVAGSHYYTESGGVHTEAVEGTDWTAGDAVPAYYTLADETYTQATGVFEAGVTYYTKSEGVYTEAVEGTDWTAGEPIPAFYKHTKIIISGAVRNVTYRLDTIVDCPMEFILPSIEDETHGCWFEMRFRHAGEYSMTLTPPEGVKIATEHTQKETAGINMIDLHYTVIDGIKIWRFMNTHSSIPT